MGVLILHCGIYNILCTGTLFFIILKNPRYMMQDYPQEITQNIEGKTQEEEKRAIVYGLPFLLILLLYPLAFAFYGKFVLGYTFLQTLFSVFLFAFTFNLVDLILIDWLVFCTITPEFIVLPGTKGNPGYKNYRYHFTAFLKGSVFSLGAAVIFALIIEGISFIV
ncbi:MAG: hypothetical protein ACLFR1_12870 [Spirochaetia bacterium]